MCSIPNELVAVHATNDQKQPPARGQFLRKSHARAFLKQTGMLLHIGIRKLQISVTIFVITVAQFFTAALLKKLKFISADIHSVKPNLENLPVTAWLA